MRRRVYDIDGIKVTFIEKKLTTTLKEGYAKAGEYQSNTVWIDPRNTRRGKRITKLHELLHHLFERSGLSEVMKVQMEERVCDELAGWLFSAAETAPELLEDIFFGRGSE